jgi:AcrR family transcriptional regulator
MRGRPITIREEDILDSARAVFLERGLEATTHDIADRAGVSESIIFYRYKTKEALFAAVIHRNSQVPAIFDTLPERVGRGALEEHLFEIGTAIIATMNTMLPLRMLSWSSPTKLNALCDLRDPNAPPLKMVRLLAGYFEAEARTGRLRPIDPEILARTFFGGVVNFVMSQHLHHTNDSLPMPAATFLRGLCQLVLDGARRLPGRSAPSRTRRPR